MKTIHLGGSGMEASEIALGCMRMCRKSQENADTPYSLAKYIHPMKKAAPGMVRIDRSEGAFRVRIDAELEERLTKN